MALFSVVQERRSGRREFVQRAGEFRQRLDTVEREWAAALEREVAARHSLSPDAAELVRRARTANPRLWERRLTDPDFLELRVGTASRPAEARVDLRPGGAAELQQEAERRLAVNDQVTVPVCVPLARTGALGVSGSPDAVHSAAQWLAVQAATLRSPADLAIAAALSSEAAESWRWLKWLPHTRPEQSPLGLAGLAADRNSTGRLLEAVTSLLRTRSTAMRDASTWAPRPGVLLVVDERAGVPRSACTELLSRGPAVGSTRSGWDGRSATCLASAGRSLRSIRRKAPLDSRTPRAVPP